MANTYYTITDTAITSTTGYYHWIYQDFPVQWEQQYQQEKPIEKGQFAVQEPAREKNIRFLNGPRASLRKHEAKV